jgi:uncharacterized Zn-binding protein involved in type VI secretion
MPRISRNKDLCRTGHKCNTVAPVNASQSSVFANGKPILVRGDRVAPHFILKRVPKVGLVCRGHKAILSGSSRRVFVQGIGVGRRGDKADKGAMAGASPNVFAG